MRPPWVGCFPHSPQQCALPHTSHWWPSSPLHLLVPDTLSIDDRARNL